MLKILRGRQNSARHSLHSKEQNADARPPFQLRSMPASKIGKRRRARSFPADLVGEVGVSEEIVDMKAEKGAWDRSVRRWSR